MPYDTKEKQNAWRRNHPEISAGWRKRNPEQSKSIRDDRDAKHRYGLTAAQAKRKRRKCCEICGKRPKKMCLDHKGPANVFNQDYRGVLCQQCNTRLGWFERLQKKILKYLER
jgi:hypothetical protein